MWIESLTIKGLKSFGENPTKVTFSKGLNVIHGSNGSGKSNLLWAIHYVLGAPSLTQQERHHFLHESHSKVKGTTEGYVLVILNNESKSLPFSSKKVSIKRVLNLKSDTYFVNSLHLRRGEFKNMSDFMLMHSFIRQGEVSKFAMMSPLQRLQITENACQIDYFNLMYEKMNKQMDRIIQSYSSSDDQVVKIEELFAKLSKMMWKSEKRRDISKQIEALEFIMNTRKLNSYQNKLNSISNELDKLILERNPSNDPEELNILEKEVKLLMEKECSLYEDIQALHQDWTCELAHCERLKFEICNIEKELSLSEDACVLEKKMESLKNDESSLEKRLSDINENLISQRELVHEAETDYEVQTLLREDLIAFLSSECVQSKEDWTSEALSKVQDLILDKEETLKKIQGEKEEIEKNIKQFEAKRTDVLTDLGSIVSQGNEAENICYADEVRQEERHVTRELNVLRKDYLSLREDYRCSEGHLMKRGRLKGLLTGIESMQHLYAELEENKSPLLDGFYGLLLDCIDEFSEIALAVSAVAGNYLFYHIVSSQMIASKLMEMFNECQLPGELFFFPLDNLQVSGGIKHGSFDPSVGVPLCSRLEFSPPEVKPAIHYVFGGWLLMKDMGVNLFQKVNVVTFDGDIRRATGVISGGYNRPGSDNATMYMNLVKKKAVLQDMEIKIFELEREHKSLGLEAYNISKNMVTQKSKEVLDDITKNQLESRLKIIESEIEFLQNSMEKSLEKEEAVKVEHGKYIQKEVYLRRGFSELKTKLTSPSFESSLVLKRSDYIKSHEGLRQMIQEKRDIESKMDAIRRTEKDLSSKLISNRRNASLIDQKKEHLTRIKEHLASLTREKSKLDQFFSAVNKEIKAKKKVIKDHEDSISGYDDKLSSAIDSLSVKKNQYFNVIKKMKEQIQYAESNSYSYVSTYEILDSKRLLGKMRECKESLEKLTSDIGNITGYDMEEFKNSFEGMKKKLDYLYTCTCAQQDIMEILSSSTDEVIRETVEKVNQYFHEVFQLLSGSHVDGKIIAVKDSEETINGLDISVSFIQGGPHSISMIDHLSGGQKTVVALSFLFSLKMCHPEFVYIMDEVDAALDPSTRRNLASCLKDLILDRSQGTNQILFTTFRKEVVEQADLCIRVRNDEGTTFVEHVSTEDALRFLTELQDY